MIKSRAGLSRMLALPLLALSLTAGGLAFAPAAVAKDLDKMMADCMKKAKMETDAMKMKTMEKDCKTHAMKTDSMQSGAMMSTDAMKPKKK